MNRKNVDKLMSALFAISSGIILVGALFQLQHYPYGKEILWTGILTSLVLSSFEINRLKRIIKDLEGKV
jgi:hypothetical protein